MSLLNTKTGFTTPWHCGVAQLADGEWVSAPVGEFRDDPRLELVYEDGRPSYFKEKPRETNAPSISETSASYLQPPKRLTSYPGSGSSSPSLSSAVSGGSTPNGRSPSPGSVSSADVGSMKQLMSDSPMNGATPTPYGRRLIPQIIDDLAFAEPRRDLFSIVTHSDNALGFRNISARAFTQAVDKLAWWLYRHVGKPTSIQPVGYIGPRKSLNNAHQSDSIYTKCEQMIFDTFC
jgi:hypothetical protein